ncbi:ISAs1 family transposase [Reticulibacter mediterranei]|uniref:ISAs1 family transposase n=1 Tax=Reticulibacter mediterranei TaxID=2778369 RepID=A0A8J3N6P8_9CHLR|nr:ISAs1 family transposase [Reticulibacter mediterranei]GHO92860.1 ISAs1 family transposase [Reticulibacter mediterranei]GHP00405.1 ISAs1 family transposase [Reticulibacter mediterranei]
MDYTTWNVPPQAEMEAAESAVLSLYEALQGLTDPRRAQGKRYSLAVILCLLVLAKLAGQKTLSAATEWIRHRAGYLAQHFELRREKMPCQTTYWNVLAKVDGKHLDEILSAFFVRWEAQIRCGDEPSRLHTPQSQADHAHLAIDGKTLRATTSQEHPIHQLSCYEVATGIVLWHCNVGAKENEISALKPLLTPSCVKGRILTLDAMHTQRDLCSRVHQLAGDYILIAKENQPTLQEDIADLLEDRGPDRRRWKQAETWDKAHGRKEHRAITCSPDLNEWFGKQWEGIEQVFRLERTTFLLKAGTLRHEVVYGLSSLSMRQAPPSRLLALIREHWAIENRLHYRRDGSLGEDACQTRTGRVPSLLAQLNSTILSLMDRVGVRNVARQMRYFDAHPQQALALLFTGSCTVY